MSSFPKPCAFEVLSSKRQKASLTDIPTSKNQPSDTSHSFPLRISVYLVKEILQWEVWSLPPHSRSTTLDQHPAKSQRFHEALQRIVSLSCDRDFWSGLLYPQLQNGRLRRSYLGNRDHLFLIFSILLPETLFFFFLFYTCSHLIFSPIWYFYFQIKTLRLLSPAVLWKGREPSSLSGFGTCLQGISL